MALIQPFDSFSLFNRSLTQEEFRELHGGTLHLYFYEVREGEEVFRTQASQVQASQAKPKGRGVAPIQKDPDSNLFLGMITLGRAENNDIVIQHERISSFHAHFRSEGERLLLTDSNSTNGTEVNGIRLTPNSAVEVRSNDLIRFGEELTACVLDVDELYLHVAGS